MSANTYEYKGSTCLGLKEDQGESPLKMGFGLRKAKLILAHVDDIQRFVQEHDKYGGQPNAEPNF